MLPAVGDSLNCPAAQFFVRDTQSMDILQEHLVRARSSGGVFARSIAQPPWGLLMPGDIQLAVHAVIQGRAWIWTADSAEPVMLEPGDLALVKGGVDHYIAHELGARVLSHDDFAIAHPGTVDPADPSTSIFLCGAYRFRGDIGTGLVDALPALVRIRASDDDPIHGVVGLISGEMTSDGSGKQTVLDRLLDILVVYGLRAGLAQSPTPPPWMRAASEPRLSAALTAIHGDARAPWTVDDLAGLSNLSRATFARVFRRTLGQSPIQYLADWRMALARDHLAADDLSLAEIADRVGYSSVYAFATAFRREHNDSPGHWRRERRAIPA